MDHTPDERDPLIVASMRAGDPQAYATMLELYGGRVAGYLRQRFPAMDEHDLQDALADALLAVAESFDGQRGSLPAWFLFLAHQQAVGRWRSRQARPDWEPLAGHPEPAAGNATPLQELATVERMHEVEKVIQSLSKLEQAVIRADVAEGGATSADALAERLQTTPGSVYAARQRARRKLWERCAWIQDMLRERDD
jgi:RNA polymerase sigma factor (sigma-70 family)